MQDPSKLSMTAMSGQAETALRSVPRPNPPTTEQTTTKAPETTKAAPISCSTTAKKDPPPCVCPVCPSAEKKDPTIDAGNTAGAVANGTAADPAKPKRSYRPLTFIHIPRSGGTTIEMMSKDDPREESWGMFNPGLKGQYKMLHVNSRGGNEFCTKHHVPPAMLPEFYGGKDTFCVVRNPYARMVSAFHFPMTKEYGDMVRAGACNATTFNKWAVKVAQDYKRNPANRDCHLMTQASYVFGFNFQTNTADPSMRYCKHQIRLENFAQDFNGLMKEYGYKDRQATKKASALTHHNEKVCKPIPMEAFSHEAIEAINDIWRADFELFGYDMVTRV